MPYNYPTPEELEKQTQTLKAFNNAGYIGGTDKSNIEKMQGSILVEPDQSPLAKLGNMQPNQPASYVGEIPYDNQFMPANRGDTMMNFANQQNMKLQELGISQKDPSIIPLHTVLGKSMEAHVAPISIGNKQRGLSGGVSMDIGQKDGPNPATLSINGMANRRFGVERGPLNYRVGATYERRFAEGGAVIDPQENSLSNPVPQDTEDQINGMMAKGGFSGGFAKGGKAEPKGALPPAANQSTTAAIEQQMRQEFQKRGLDFDKFLQSAPMRYAAAKSLAKMGNNGDTILAHINPREAEMLKRMGGSGTINPKTGLPQFEDIAIDTWTPLPTVDVIAPYGGAYDTGPSSSVGSSWDTNSSTYDFFEPDYYTSSYTSSYTSPSYDYGPSYSSSPNFYDYGPALDYGSPYSGVNSFGYDTTTGMYVGNQGPALDNYSESYPSYINSITLPNVSQNIIPDIAQNVYNLYGISPDSSLGQISQFDVGNVSNANATPTVAFNADVSGLTSYDPLTGAIADYTKSLEPASTPIGNAVNQASSPGIMDLISNALVGKAEAATRPESDFQKQNEENQKDKGETKVPEPIEKPVQFSSQPKPPDIYEPTTKDIISSALNAIKDVGTSAADYLKTIGRAEPPAKYGSQENPYLHDSKGNILPDPNTGQKVPNPNVVEGKSAERLPSSGESPYTNTEKLANTFDFKSLNFMPPANAAEPAKPQVGNLPSLVGYPIPAANVPAAQTAPAGATVPGYQTAVPSSNVPVPEPRPAEVGERSPLAALGTKAENAVRGAIDDFSFGRTAANALPALVLGPAGGLANMAAPLFGLPNMADLVGIPKPSDVRAAAEDAKIAQMERDAKGYSLPYDWANKAPQEDFGIKAPNMEGVNNAARISNLMTPTTSMNTNELLNQLHAEPVSVASQFKLPEVALGRISGGGGGGGGGGGSSPTAQQIAAAIVAQQKASERLSPVAKYVSSGRQYVTPKMNYYTYGYGPQRSFYAAEGGHVSPLNTMRKS